MKVHLNRPWIEMQLGNATFVVEQEIGMRVFELLTSGAGLYHRDYDWDTRQNMVHPLSIDAVSMRYISAESFAMMKMLGTVRREEKLAKEMAEKAVDIK